MMERSQSPLRRLLPQVTDTLLSDKRWQDKLSFRGTSFIEYELKLNKQADKPGGITLREPKGYERREDRSKQPHWSKPKNNKEEPFRLLV